MKALESDQSPSLLIRAVSGIIFLLSLWRYLRTAFSLNVNLIQGDQWVWMREVILPLNNGEITTFEAITYEYSPFSHSHIPQLATWVLNDRFFGIDLRIDTWIGVVSILLSIGVISAFLRSVVDSATATTFSLLIGSVFLHSSVQSGFSWTVLQFQWFYTLIALSGMYAVHRFPALRRSRGDTFPNAVRTCLVFAPVAAWLLILGDSIGVATAAALCLIPLALASWGSGRITVREGLVVFAGRAASLAVVAALSWMFLKGSRVHRSNQSALESLLESPEEYVVGPLNALSLSVVPVRTDNALLLDYWTRWVFLVLVLATFTAILWFLRGLDPRVLVVPASMLMAGMIWIAGVAFSRIPTHGSEYMLAPRYTLFTVPFITGSILLFAAVWVGSGDRRTSRVVAAGSVAVCLLLLFVSYEAAEFNRYSVAYQERIIDILRTGDSAEIGEANARCANDYCSEALRYLEAKRKNIFAE